MIFGAARESAESLSLYGLKIAVALEITKRKGIAMLTWITNLMNSAGYMAITFLMFLENVFPPIPSELIMPLAGYTATQGKLTLIGAIIAGTLGSVLGALPLYFLGKVVGGQRLMEWADKHGKWLTVSGDDIDNARKWFERHGGAAVLIGRLVPGVRSLVSIPAGVAQMNLALFLLYSSIGAALWSSLLAYLGYMLGSNFKQVDKYFGPASYVVLGAIFAFYIYRVVQQHKKQNAA